MTARERAEKVATDIGNISKSWGSDVALIEHALLETIEAAAQKADGWEKESERLGLGSAQVCAKWIAAEIRKMGGKEKPCACDGEEYHQYDPKTCK